MAKFYSEFNQELIEFVHDQKIFFVGTAGENGTVNVSPKGLESLKIIDSKKIVWLNLTGSGNESAAHILQKNRMTIMFCSFEGKPKILRVYGKAKIHHTNDEFYKENIALFPNHGGERQLFEVDVDQIQISCGFAVPLFEFKGERDQLNNWAQKQGQEKIENYWKEKNSKSIDGFETGILK